MSRRQWCGCSRLSTIRIPELFPWCTGAPARDGQSQQPIRVFGRPSSAPRHKTAFVSPSFAWRPSTRAPWARVPRILPGTLQAPFLGWKVLSSFPGRAGQEVFTTFVALAVHSAIYARLPKANPTWGRSLAVPPSSSHP